MAVEKWMDLNGKVVIVTGGSQGIGEHVVQNLRANNAFVVVADLRINENFIEKYGKIDAIVNNAGVSRPRMLVDYYGQKPEYELTEDDLDFMYNVNQKGVVLCAQAVAREMIKQKSGVIINLSSQAGIHGSKGQSAYSGTKAAVHSYTMAWAKELGPFNIRVVGVAPDVNERTPMNNDAAFEALAYTRGTDPKNTTDDYTKTIPLGRPGKLDEVADLIAYLVSDHSSYITGTTINISGGKSCN